MIRVLYRWQLHPGTEASFERAWAAMTRAIRSTQPGAMGSTLLRDPVNPSRYSALARWRSRDDWQALQVAPSPAKEAGAAMKAAIAASEPPEFFEEREDLITGGPLMLAPIGVVRSSRVQPQDDGWDAESATIELSPGLPEDALLGLDAFSHVEVLYIFHHVNPLSVERGARHPRDNPAWPRVGIFAQRGRARPNCIGATVCRVLGVAGRALQVAGLDAVDGSPVLDLKPWMLEFAPRGPVHQPAWVSELMRRYW